MYQQEAPRAAAATPHRYHRPMRPTTATLLGLVLGLALGLAACDVRGPRPDVVLVLVDTLRADRLGAYGYALPTSPRLDAVAAEGLVFERAYSASTWTKPAVASLFTALMPAEHGIVRQLREGDPELLTQVVPHSLPTLAERFRADGYRTVAVVRQPNMLPQMGFARGFDVYDAPAHEDAFALVERLLARLDEDERGRPVFLYLHLLDVHWPYDEMLPSLAPDAFGPLSESEWAWMDRPTVRRAKRHGWRQVDWPTITARYDHGVAFVDAAIGRLVEGLTERGRWDRTLLAVTSDHGEGFLERRPLRAQLRAVPGGGAHPPAAAAAGGLGHRARSAGERRRPRRPRPDPARARRPRSLAAGLGRELRRDRARRGGAGARRAGADGARQRARRSADEADRRAPGTGALLRPRRRSGREGGPRRRGVRRTVPAPPSRGSAPSSATCGKPPPPEDVAVEYTPEQLEELRALGYL